MNLDLVVKHALAAGDLMSGIPIDMIRHRSPHLTHAAMCSRSEIRKAPPWSLEDDRFLTDNLGYLSEAEIARRLGRTINAVRIRWKRELQLPAPSCDPRYITANQIAHLLDIDAHAVTHWIDSGLLAGETLPSPRRIRRVLRSTLVRWLLNHDNWIWFRPERVRDQHIRKMIELKRRRWNDDWWSTSDVARHHGVDTKDVLRYINAGKIKARQAPTRGGRALNPGWSNWFVLRSEATRHDLRFCRGRGAGRVLDWSEKADEFMVLASAIGLSYSTIAHLMGGGEWDSQRVSYRLSEIHASGYLHNLKVLKNSNGVLADWRIYAGRFPTLARAVQKFVAGSHLSKQDLLYLRGVLTAWANYYAQGQEQRAFAERLSTASNAGERSIRNDYRSLLEWGVDPFCDLPNS